MTFNEFQELLFGEIDKWRSAKGTFTEALIGEEYLYGAISSLTSLYRKIKEMEFEEEK